MYIFVKLERLTRRSLTIKVLIYFVSRFAGNKSTLQSVAIMFNITQSTLFRIIDRVMDFLLDMGPEIIKMPLTVADKRDTETEFKKVSQPKIFF